MVSRSQSDEIELPDVARAYISDLEFALRDSEDSDEIVRSVREHLVEAVSGAPDYARSQWAQAALDELGPVEQIVAASTTKQSPRPGPLQGDITLIVLAVLSIPLAGFVPWIGIPLAAATLIVSVALFFSRRRSRHPRGLALIASICAALGLAVGAILIFVALPANSGPPSEQPLTVVPAAAGLPA